MALTRITSDGITDGTITGTDLTTNIDLVDNQKLRLGTGNDLQIYHDGSNSYIKDTGTGNLRIWSDDLRIQDTSGNSGIQMIEGGAVNLYHSGTKKFETTSAGATVTGELRATADLKMNTADNQKINLGMANDLQIYHDGNNSRIENSTGQLKLKAATAGTSVQMLGAGDEMMVQAIGNAAVELYYDNTKRFETTSSGATVTGQLNVAGVLKFDNNVNSGLDIRFEPSTNSLDFVDNVKARFGTGDDLQIYHDGSNSYIDETGTGGLLIKSGDIYLRNPSNVDMIHAQSGGYVKLYYDGSQKFETTSGGVNVTGALTVNGSALASATNSPAFSAYRSSNYSPSNGSEVVIDFDQERFDTNSCYNFNNGRFTPTTAGNYQFNLNFFWSGTSSNKIKQAHGFIRKNGSENIGQFWHDANDSYKENRQGVSVSTIVAMNGSSDYVEAIGYCLVDSGSPNFNAQGATFSGFKLA